MNLSSLTGKRSSRLTNHQTLVNFCTEIGLFLRRIGRRVREGAQKIYLPGKPISLPGVDKFQSSRSNNSGNCYGTCLKVSNLPRYTCLILVWFPKKFHFLKAFRNKYSPHSRYLIYLEYFVTRFMGNSNI